MARVLQIWTREAIRDALRPHGTRGRYVGGCRCPKCRTANADYQRDLYARKHGRNGTRRGRLNFRSTA